jgi:hypothetical protein
VSTTPLQQRQNPFGKQQDSDVVALNLFRARQLPEPVVINDDTDEIIPSFALNVPAAAAWVALVAWAFTVAPGELNSASDTAMLAGIMANPAHPGMNELYYTIFNFCAVIPVISSGSHFAAGSKQGTPGGAFFVPQFVHWLFWVWTLLGTPRSPQG